MPLEKSDCLAALVRVAEFRLSWISVAASPRPCAGVSDERLVLEKLLASEQLEIRIFQPFLAHSVVRKVVRVLQDRQACHQPGRQQRLARLVGIDRAEALIQEPPGDLPSKLGQIVVRIDDRIETGEKHVRLPAIPPLLRQHDAL